MSKKLWAVSYAQVEEGGKRKYIFAVLGIVGPQSMFVFYPYAHHTPCSLSTGIKSEVVQEQNRQRMKWRDAWAQTWSKAFCNETNFTWGLRESGKVMQVQ